MNLNQGIVGKAGGNFSSFRFTKTKRSSSVNSEKLLTPADMDLVQGVFGRGEHPHVGPEFLGQRLDHVLRGGCAGHADALCGEVPGHSVLEVKAHYAMELQLLQRERKKSGD